MWYSSSSGRIELRLTKIEAATGSHSGSCDSDVAYLRTVPRIRRQLDRIDPALLARELQEFGCWSDEDLRDHSANLNRILWIACGDITDGA